MLLKVGSPYPFYCHWNHGCMVLVVIVDNLIKVITVSTLWYGGLFESNLTSKFINFGVDGVLVFQGARISVEV